jgi:3-hydroxyacyl-CoA dehydrogenase
MDVDALERAAALITGTTDYDGFGEVDFVIEAVPERIELKQEVFTELDAATPGHAILATNTSSLSITELGEATTRPEKVVGFHFFYPVSTARAIEVTEGADTSPETAQVASNFAQAIRKVAIRCGDSPGFAVNRILNAGVSEWWRAQEESGVDPQEFDGIVASASASGYGPFFIADVLGIDTIVHVSEYLQANFGERFHVHGPMRDLVAKGDLGMKTGKGFYDHAR